MSPGVSGVKTIRNCRSKATTRSDGGYRIASCARLGVPPIESATAGEADSGPSISAGRKHPENSNAATVVPRMNRNCTSPICTCTRTSSTCAFHVPDDVRKPSRPEPNALRRPSLRDAVSSTVRPRPTPGPFGRRWAYRARLARLREPSAWRRRGLRAFDQCDLDLEDVSVTGFDDLDIPAAVAAAAIDPLCSIRSWPVATSDKRAEDADARSPALAGELRQA